MNKRFKLLCRVCGIEPELAWSVLGYGYQEAERPALLAAWAGMQDAGLDPLLTARALSRISSAHDGEQPPDYFCLYRCLPTSKPQPWRYLSWHPRRESDAPFWDLLATRDCQELPRPPRALHTVMLSVLIWQYNRAADNIGTILTDAESAANEGDDR